MAAEKKETKFFPMKTADLVKQENFMKSLGAAIEGMKAFEEQKANNMYQNLDKNVITRPVEIKLNKDGGFDKEKRDKSLTQHEPVEIQNAVNLMHTQLATGNRENPIFISEKTMKDGNLMPKKGVEPTYVVELNSFNGEYTEKKMYHISQVENDPKRLEKANDGRSKKLAAIDLSDIVVKVPEHERKYADNLRKSIAHFVETEGKGKLANIADDKFAEKILGYALQQRSEEQFMTLIAKTIRKATAGMDKIPGAVEKFHEEYGKVRAELLKKDPTTKKRQPTKNILAAINKIADGVKGKETKKEATKAAAPEKAPKAEKKEKAKAKKKEAPAR